MFSPSILTCSQQARTATKDFQSVLQEQQTTFKAELFTVTDVISSSFAVAANECYFSGYEFVTFWDARLKEFESLENFGTSLL
jgi:hypothetical protein